MPAKWRCFETNFQKRKPALRQAGRGFPEGLSVAIRGERGSYNVDAAAQALIAECSYPG